MIRKLAVAVAVVLLHAGIVIGLAISPVWAVVAHGIKVAAPHHVTGSVSVHPAKATETTKGNVSFALVSKGLIPRTKYTVTAATLTSNCKNSINSKTFVTDLRGVFNHAAKAGPNCVAGTFTIEVQKTASPFTIYRAQIKIVAP